MLSLVGILLVPARMSEIGQNICVGSHLSGSLSAIVIIVKWQSVIDIPEVRVQLPECWVTLLLYVWQYVHDCQGTFSHSCLSLLSHCGVILVYKKGISVCELIYTSKKQNKKNTGREWMVEHSPQILARERKKKKPPQDWENHCAHYFLTQRWVKLRAVGEDC